MNSKSLFRHLQEPTNFLTMLGIVFIVFDVSYYLMSNLPGSQDDMCVLGAALNWVNIFFAALMSLLSGIFVVGFISLIKQRAIAQAVALSSLSGFGLIAGGLTLFCTICTLPVISLFGLSLGFSIFTEYNFAFKILSLLLMSIGLYILNNQLQSECQLCKIE